MPSNSLRSMASSLSPVNPSRCKSRKLPFVKSSGVSQDYTIKTTSELDTLLQRNSELLRDCTDSSRLERLKMIRSSIQTELNRRKTRDLDRLVVQLNTLEIVNSHKLHSLIPRKNEGKIALMNIQESSDLLKLREMELSIARAQVKSNTNTPSGQVTPTTVDSTLSASSSFQNARMMAFLFPEPDSDEDEEEQEYENDDNHANDHESMDYEMSSDEQSEVDPK